jgi:orotate phosphoribosyltransferase
MSPEVILVWISGIGLVAVATILVLREIAGTLYTLFHWPAWLVKILEKQRSEEVRRVLNALGVSDQQAERLRTVPTREAIRKGKAEVGDSAGERSAAILRRATTAGTFSVGRRRAFDLPYYVDLFSEVVSSNTADECSRLMLAALHDVAGDFQFTRVIGIKSGSPTLATAVAARLSMPVALIRASEDAKPDGIGVHPRIDGIVEAGEKVLIVDDSATGGRMILDAVSVIELIGAKATDVLVFFEPLGKGARQRISGTGARFTSVIEMDGATITQATATPDSKRLLP